MERVTLEQEFDIHAKVKIVVMVHLYSIPDRVDKLKKVCKKLFEKHKILSKKNATKR